MLTGLSAFDGGFPLAVVCLGGFVWLLERAVRRLIHGPDRVQTALLMVGLALLSWGAAGAGQLLYVLEMTARESEFTRIAARLMAQLPATGLSEVSEDRPHRRIRVARAIRQRGSSDVHVVMTVDSYLRAGLAVRRAVGYFPLQPPSSGGTRCYRNLGQHWYLYQGCSPSTDAD